MRSLVDFGTASSWHDANPRDGQHHKKFLSCDGYLVASSQVLLLPNPNPNPTLIEVECERKRWITTSSTPVVCPKSIPQPVPKVESRKGLFWVDSTISSSAPNKREIPPQLPVKSKWEPNKNKIGSCVGKSRILIPSAFWFSNLSQGMSICSLLSPPLKYLPSRNEQLQNEAIPSYDSRLSLDDFSSTRVDRSSR